MVSRQLTVVEAAEQRERLREFIARFELAADIEEAGQVDLTLDLLARVSEFRGTEVAAA